MKFLLYAAPLALLMNCTPRISYLGESYPPSQQQPIEVFYDEEQITQPYQVIGSLVNEGSGAFVTQEKVQQAIVDEAASVGADAVVFHDVDVEMTDDGQSTILKAKAIRY